MTTLLGVLVLAAVMTATYALITSWRVRRHTIRRLYADATAEVGQESSLTGRDSPLARWLARAGYRRAEAATLFVATTIASVGIGIIVSRLYGLVLFAPLTDAVAAVPGSAGDVLVLALQAGPWVLLAVCGLVPTLFVRSMRRRRVQSFEQDLPLVLELFATMAEAGMGFDAALAKIVRAQGPERALTSELVNFQHDMLAGMSRSQALRQLARRADLPSLTSFTSALIQAEQIGASLAETLQYQAVDLRQRRREQALLQAQALPVKLVFPLVVCFLPGIFVSTLAPVLFQMVQVADGVLRSGQ